MKIEGDARGPRVAFKAKIWLYEGKAAWHFVTLPKKLSAKLKAAFGQVRRGWGSLPVYAMLGKSRWRTSIFPDGKRGAYLLPLKAEVRKKEKARAGEAKAFVLEMDMDRL